MSSDQPPSNDIAKAEDPFHTGGDVILRSSDGADFHVFKLILSQASPFFHDMFTLPQPKSETKATSHSVSLNLGLAHAEDGSELPVIPVTESRAVLDDVLRICYPCPSPTISSAHRISQVLDAAVKYLMAGVASHARGELARLTATDPVFAYIVACRFGFAPIAKEAAESSIILPVSQVLNPAPKCLELARATDFQRLSYYRVEIQKATLECLTDSSWTTRNRSTQQKALYFWTQSHGSQCPTYFDTFSGNKAQSWWRERMQILIKTMPDHFDTYTVYTGLMASFLSSPPAKCPSCLAYAVTHIREFTEELCQEIKFRQSKVVLDLSHLTEQPWPPTEPSSSISAT